MANQKPAERARIELDDVFKELQIPAGRKLTITKVGLYLALFVLGYMSIVTLIILIDYLAHVPRLPANVDSADAINNYKVLSEIAALRSKEMFELMIAKTLLPVLTAILGYIFGVRGVEKGEAESDDE